MCDKGGLDPNERDLPLLQTLKDRLNPNVSSLQQALEGTTIEAFLNAFFGVVSPFIGMMSDLLGYFEAANATEGPEEWVLVLGEGGEELEVRLDHFRKWVAKSAGMRREIRVVPVLDSHGLWLIREQFFPLGPAQTDSRGNIWRDQPEPRRRQPDLVEWLSNYEADRYGALPQAVYTALKVKGPIGEVAALVVEIYDAILAIARSRDALREQGRWIEGLQSQDDFWSAHGLWLFESDYWIRGRVLDLAAWLEAPPTLQKTVQEGLANQFASLPKRRARININIQDIEQILSLPIWKRRYELYSAWVLTRMLASLVGHQIELHHEGGKISFAFRETLMASIVSSNPPMEIFSEKRTAAVGLVGHGRSTGVQPDYSVWEQSGSCRLVVECKHYKRSSTRNFADALNDYSQALGSAQVVLANYGPVGPGVEKAIEHARRDRCVAIGRVNPEEPQSLIKFSETVRKTIGEPNRLFSRSTLELAGASDSPFLLVDVSGSMRSVLTAAKCQTLVANVIKFNNVAGVATADTTLLAEGGITPDEVNRILSYTGTGSTALHDPVEQLVRKHSALVVLTDSEGLAQLAPFQISRVETIEIDGAKLNLVSVRSDPS